MTSVFQSYLALIMTIWTMRLSVRQQQTITGVLVLRLVTG